MEDSEWETIQTSSSAAQSDEGDGEAVVVVTRPTHFDDPPVFAPTNHNGFPVFPRQIQDDHLQPQEPLPETPSSPSSYSSSSARYSSDITDGELPQRPEVKITLVKASLGILSSWVLRIACGIRSRVGFWSIASVAAFMAVTTYARRWQQWRRLTEKDDIDKLLLLLNQKDEKIKQLLLQIEKMNETLSARRRVPVFRVVVDSPLMIGPRSNWKPT